MAGRPFMDEGSGLVFRHEVAPGDVEAVRSMTESTGFFSAEEVFIAEGLVRERLEKGPGSGYHFIFAQEYPGAGQDGSRHAGDTVGYTCYGPIPGTQSSFDLYWIVVGQDRRGRGIGRALLAQTEEAVASSGGIRLFAETSSRELYDPTRRFYRSSGFRQEAFLEDFYSPGDGKIIFVKKIT